MTTALAVRSAPYDEGALSRLQESRGMIRQAPPEALIDLCIYAEAAREAGKARRAMELVREAAETRIRAEYRLGQLWHTDESMDERFPTMPGHCWELGEVPEALFERALASLIPRDKLQGDRAHAARGVMSTARLLSLRKVDDQLWIAYDGSYYSKRSDGKWTARISFDLERARQWVMETLPRRKGSKNQIRLDQAYSHARILASDLSRLRSAFSGESAAAIAEAELLAAKTAENIDRARRMAV